MKEKYFVQNYGLFLLFSLLLTFNLMVISKKIEPTKSLKKNLKDNDNKNDEVNKENTKAKLPLRENPYKNMDILNDPNIDPKDLPFNIKGAFVNSFGIKVNDKTEIDKPPFKISRCDQFVSFITEYIPDLKDYLNREKGFVVINAYYVHLFKENKKDLIGSVLLTQSGVAPMEPRGAKDCVQIDGGNLSNNIILCFKDKKLLENIFGVLDEFSSCRAASKQNNSEKDTDVKIKLLKDDCPLLNTKENPQDLINRIEKNKNDRSKNEKGEEEKIWHPAPNIVPGSE